MRPRWGFVVVLFLFWLIFLILAGVFPLDAFKTLYGFDHFVIVAFKINTFLNKFTSERSWCGLGAILV